MLIAGGRALGSSRPRLPPLQLAPRLMHGWPSFDLFFLAFGFRAEGSSILYEVRTSGAGEKDLNE